MDYTYEFILNYFLTLILQILYYCLFTIILFENVIMSTCAFSVYNLYIQISNMSPVPRKHNMEILVEFIISTLSFNDVPRT